MRQEGSPYATVSHLETGWEKNEPDPSLILHFNAIFLSVHKLPFHCILECSHITSFALKIPPLF